MSAQKSQHQNNAMVQGKKRAFKIPPKIPNKPKMRTYLSKEGDSALKNNCMENFEENLPNSSLSIDPSLAPVSEIRSKFQSMKVEFTKPVSDPVYFEPLSVNGKDTKEPLRNTADKLFKDILEMKSLPNLSESLSHIDLHSTSKCVAIDQNPNKRNNNNFNDVASPDSISSRCENKQTNINYRINHKVLPDLGSSQTQPSFSNDKMTSTITELPKDLQNTNYVNSIITSDDSTLDHASNHRLASGSGYQASFTGTAIGLFQTKVPTAATVTDSSCHLPKTAGTLFSDPKSLENCENSCQNSKQFVHDVEVVCDIGNDILYYDNMDVMKKVKQKRQDNNMSKELWSNQFLNTSLTKDAPNKFHQVERCQYQKDTALNSSSLNQFTLQNRGVSADTNTMWQSVEESTKFRNAIGDLEYEYLKLKANLDQESNIPGSVTRPPKLPPKQLKFNKTLSKNASNEQDDLSTERCFENSFKHTGEKRQNHTQNLPFNVTKNSVDAGMHMQHNMQPVPAQTLQYSFDSQFQSKQPPKPLELHLMAQQDFSEDVRARQLVDEPLAPIIEEETYEESSFPSLFVGGDTAFYVDEHLSNFPLDREVHKRNETLLDSASLTDKKYDNSTIRWDINPFAMLKATRDVTSVTTHITRSRDISVNRQHGLLSENKALREREKEKSSIQAQKSKNGSINLQSNLNDLSLHKELAHDVEPYGMVDLTTLKPIYKELKSVSKTDYLLSDSESSFLEHELTPSSIMSSVNEFNAAFGMSPKFQTQTSDGDCIDMPNFPVIVETKNNRMKAQNLQNKQTTTISEFLQKCDSDANLQKQSIDQYEGVGYDNLENYGGAARQAAKNNKSNKHGHLSRKRIDGEQFLDSKSLYEQSKSRDSLSSIPGLARQSAGSRASFPLPFSESRLAYHSSAVSAVDRQSGNITRSKKSARQKSLKKSSSFRQIEKHQPNTQNLFSMLPRSRSCEIDDVFEANSSQLNFSNNENIQRKSINSTEASLHNLQRHLRNVSIEGSCRAGEFLSAHNLLNNDDVETLKVTSHGDQFHETSSIPKQSQKQLSLSIKDTTKISNLGSKKIYEKRDMQKYLDEKTSGISKASLNNLVTEPFFHSDSDYEECLDERIVNVCESVELFDKDSFQSDLFLMQSTPNHSEESFKIERKSSSSEFDSRQKRFDSFAESISCKPSDANRLNLKNKVSEGDESKYISPSLRRKNLLLKRIKSPGGRKSITQRGGKSSDPSEEEKTSDNQTFPIVDTKTTTLTTNEARYSLQLELPAKHVHPPRRSASQRLVDRRGKNPLHEEKKLISKLPDSELILDNTHEQDLKQSKKSSSDKLRMSSRWRRSKSQDRQSPTRSKSKERKFFGKRSKSQERPESKEIETNAIEDGEQKRGRGIFGRNRSSSRKRDRREKSSERNEEENSTGKRGRNPVKFLRKLLRNKKDTNEEEIQLNRVPVAQNCEDLNQYKEKIVPATEDKISQERISPPLNKSMSGNHNRTLRRKVMKSPPSHRAKKISSALASARYLVDQSTETHSVRNEISRENEKVLESSNLDLPSLYLPASRDDNHSNFTLHSDSENSEKREEEIKKKAFQLSQLQNLGDLKLTDKKRILRKKSLTNQDSDSDIATNVLLFGAESSDLVQSDGDIGNSLSRYSLQRNGSSKFKRRRKSTLLKRSHSDPILTQCQESKSKSTNSRVNNFNLRMVDQEKKESSKSNIQPRRNCKEARRQTAPIDLPYANYQREKYKTLVSLNAQTIRKVTERWLSDWRNQLPVGGFLITSWSDVALASHHPLCMIGRSVVYDAVSTGNNQFNLACQLYDQRDVDERMLRTLDNCALLPAHPNICGVCSHFSCRVPKSLLDPRSGGGAIDAVCVVLSSRPYQSLQEYLDLFISKEDPTEFHKNILITALQLLLGIKHLVLSGFNLRQIHAEHLFITQNKNFLQILPHTQGLGSVGNIHPNMTLESHHKFDPEFNSTTISYQSHLKYLAHLIKKFLSNKNLSSHSSGLGQTSTSVVFSEIVPNTKYSDAIKHFIHYLEQSPSTEVDRAAEIVECALWGPENLEDIGVNDVNPYTALELWIEMEQAKLVNNLAVLTPNERMIPTSFLKHQYFASITPEALFNGLKALQRII